MKLLVVLYHFFAERNIDKVLVTLWNYKENMAKDIMYFFARP